MKKVLIALSVLALVSCGGGGAGSATKPPPPPAVDRTTPDRAIKSYWAMRDYMDQVRIPDLLEYREREKSRESPLRALFSAEAVGESGPPSVSIFRRDIESVSTETQTRAVVVTRIRNASPIPQGAQPTAAESEDREKGTLFKYVLDRREDGWLIAEVWEFERYGARGWSKLLPADNRPTVPTLTFNGW